MSSRPDLFMHPNGAAGRRITEHLARLCGRLAFGVVLGVLVLASSRAAAQTPGLAVTISGVDASAWPDGNVVVTVVDGQGRPVPGLTADSFKAQVNDTDVPVSKAALGVDTATAAAVVLVLDTSGSMEGGAIDQAKAAARTFLDSLNPSDSVAVLTFDDQVETVLPFTQDRAAAAAAIDGLNAQGETALYQATSDSAALAASAGSSREAVVLLSDGIDHGSAISSEGALAAAKSAGVPFFVIGLGADLDRAYLQELTTTSGGQFAETPSPEGLTQLYQDIAGVLRGQYVLTIDASEAGVKETEPASLLVAVTAGETTGTARRDVCAQPLCLSLRAGPEDVATARTLRATVVGAEPVSMVTFSVDSKTVATFDKPPYEYRFDPATLEDGEHRVVVEAVTTSGQKISTDVALSTGAVASASKGLSGYTTYVVAIAVIVIAVAVVFLLLKRRRSGGDATRPVESINIPRRPQPEAGVEPSPRALWPEGPPSAPPVTAQEQLGRLVATSGDLAGQSFEVGGAPASVGFGQRCAIRVPEPPEGDDTIAAEHARVWVRDNHLMVHELRRLTAMGATGGTWAILNPGDIFAIGPHTFRFERLSQEAAQGAPSGAPAAAAAGATPPPAPFLAVAGQPASAIPSMNAPTAPLSREPAIIPSRDLDVIRPHAEQPASDIPNILRSGPSANPDWATPDDPAGARRAAELAAAPTEDVPNILRSGPSADPDWATPDDPAGARRAAELAAAPTEDVPNILRSAPQSAPDQPATLGAPRDEPLIFHQPAALPEEPPRAPEPATFEVPQEDPGPEPLRMKANIFEAPLKRHAGEGARFERTPSAAQAEPQPSLPGETPFAAGSRTFEPLSEEPPRGSGIFEAPLKRHPGEGASQEVGQSVANAEAQPAPDIFAPPEQQSAPPQPEPFTAPPEQMPAGDAPIVRKDIERLAADGPPAAAPDVFATPLAETPRYEEAPSFPPGPEQHDPFSVPPESAPERDSPIVRKYMERLVAEGQPAPAPDVFATPPAETPRYEEASSVQQAQQSDPFSTPPEEMPGADSPIVSRYMERLAAEGQPSRAQDIFANPPTEPPAHEPERVVQFPAQQPAPPRPSIFDAPLKRHAAEPAAPQDGASEDPSPGEQPRQQQTPDGWPERVEASDGATQPPPAGYEPQSAPEGTLGTSRLTEPGDPPPTRPRNESIARRLEWLQQLWPNQDQ